MKKTLRKIYHKIPIKKNIRIQVKNLIFEYGAFLFKCTQIYADWQYRKSLNFANNRAEITSSIPLPKVKNIKPKKIIICVYLTDLTFFDEFAEFCSNIPQTYDLLIVMHQSEFINSILESKHKFYNLDTLKIEISSLIKCNNVPFFLDCRSELRHYEILCNINISDYKFGNNSLDLKEENLECLLGSTDRIKQILWLLRSDNANNIGLVFSEPDLSIPYWSYTWLNFRGISSRILAYVKAFTSHSSYTDFPFMNSYWSRMDALRPYLTANSLYDIVDKFTIENPTQDYPFAERCIIPINTSQKFNFAVLNNESKTYSLNRSNKNLLTYCSKNKAGFLDYISQFETISFDVFDTLITRVTLTPDCVLKMLSIIVDKSFLIANFYEVRKKAESELREKLGTTLDCSIDEIYARISRTLSLDFQVVQKIKHLEIDLEIKLSVPRKDIVDVYVELINQGKNVILISDMYLPQSVLVKLLKKSGIFDYQGIFVSCESHMRKDSGEVWNWVISKFSKETFVHVGDNEFSDIYLPHLHQLNNYHLMSGYNLFLLNNLSSVINSKLTIADEVVLGLITNRLYNSPFMAESFNQEKYNSIEDFAYVFIGPTILYFLLWLSTQIKANSDQTVLFLAREGHLLLNCYNIVKTYLPELPDGQYFLSSRRAASVAAINEVDDIDNLLDIRFSGNLSDLMEHRFGVKIQDKNTKLVHIQLPEDKDRVRLMVIEYKDLILANSAAEKNAYLKYIESLKFKSNTFSVVDVGYAGSIQYHLAKIFEQPIPGYYFATNSMKVGLKYPSNTMSACFVENESHRAPRNNIYKYHLLLEAILTSPVGQLEHFKMQGVEAVPVHKDKHLSDFDSIFKIQESVLRFVNDAMLVLQHGCLDQLPSKNLVENLFAYPIKNHLTLSDSIKNTFLVEDNYCSGKILSIFEYYGEEGYIES